MREVADHELVADVRLVLRHADVEGAVDAQRNAECADVGVVQFVDSALGGVSGDQVLLTSCLVRSDRRETQSERVVEGPCVGLAEHFAQLVDRVEGHFLGDAPLVTLFGRGVESVEGPVAVLVVLLGLFEPALEVSEDEEVHGLVESQTGLGIGCVDVVIEIVGLDTGLHALLHIVDVHHLPAVIGHTFGNVRVDVPNQFLFLLDLVFALAGDQETQSVVVRVDGVATCEAAGHTLSVFADQLAVKRHVDRGAVHVGQVDLLGCEVVGVGREVQLVLVVLLEDAAVNREIDGAAGPRQLGVQLLQILDVLRQHELQQKRGLVGRISGEDVGKADQGSHAIGNGFVKVGFLLRRLIYHLRVQIYLFVQLHQLGQGFGFFGHAESVVAVNFRVNWVHVLATGAKSSSSLVICLLVPAVRIVARVRAFRVHVSDFSGVALAIVPDAAGFFFAHFQERVGGLCPVSAHAFIYNSGVFISNGESSLGQR